MTVAEQLQQIAQADNSQPEPIKQTCVAIAEKLVAQQSLDQNDQRDYAAFKAIVDGYVSQVN